MLDHYFPKDDARLIATCVIWHDNNPGIVGPIWPVALHAAPKHRDRGPLRGNATTQNCLVRAREKSWC